MLQSIPSFFFRSLYTVTHLFDIPGLELTPVESADPEDLPVSFERNGVLLALRLEDAVAEEEDMAVALLPADAKLRILSIRDPERRRQSLWARMLLALASERCGVSLYEHPPYGPRAKNDGKTLHYVSIAHTKRYAAAAISPQPVGIDAEFCRKLRDPKAICEYAFAPDVASYTLEQIGGENDFPEILPFYALWGMREATIKLNAPYGDFRLSLVDTPLDTTMPVLKDTRTNELLYPRFYVTGHGHWGGLCQGFEDPEKENPPEENPTILTVVTNAPMVHAEITSRAVLEYFEAHCPNAWIRAQTAVTLGVAHDPTAPEWKRLEAMPAEWPL